MLLKISEHARSFGETKYVSPLLEDYKSLDKYKKNPRIKAAITLKNNLIMKQYTMKKISELKQNFIMVK